MNSTRFRHDIIDIWTFQSTETLQLVLKLQNAFNPYIHLLSP